MSGFDSSVIDRPASARGDDTCAVQSGAAFCWGLNTYGQVGDGSKTSRTAPQQVVGLTAGVTAVSAPGVSACAIVNGGVQCWGNNFYGQLGDGTTTNRTTPVAVVGLASGVTAISAGDASCALTNTGGVKCWGSNHQGAVGDGTTTNRSTPVDVVGLTAGVAAIAAGTQFSCALTTTGGVKCWGYNANGELGDGSTTTRTTPVDVIGLGSGITAISAGSSSACALTGAGGLWCWGGNSGGAIGDGTTSDRLAPVLIGGLPPVVAISVRPIDHACALTASGQAFCWGSNQFGQVGDGTTATRLVPTEVHGF